MTQKSADEIEMLLGEMKPDGRSGAYRAMQADLRTAKSKDNDAFHDVDYIRTYDDTLADIKVIMDQDPNYTSSSDSGIRPYRTIKYTRVTGIMFLRLQNKFDSYGDLNGLEITLSRTRDGLGANINIYTF